MLRVSERRREGTTPTGFSPQILIHDPRPTLFAKVGRGKSVSSRRGDSSGFRTPIPRVRPDKVILEFANRIAVAVAAARHRPINRARARAPGPERRILSRESYRARLSLFSRYNGFITLDVKINCRRRGRRRERRPRALLRGRERATRCDLFLAGFRLRSR